MEKEFDYGQVVISHRLNINKAINHEKINITGGIRMGLVNKCRNSGSAEEGIKYDSYWEVQIIYKPNAPQGPTELFKGSLDDYCFDIKHKGNMQVEL